MCLQVSPSLPCSPFEVPAPKIVSIFDEVNITLLTNTTGTPNDVPIINDPNRRIYRGLDPSLQALDRVEVVQFPKPGTYLVICGVLPHYQGCTDMSRCWRQV